MRVQILLVACLIAGACAQDTGTNFFQNLKTSLQGVIDHVKENGKNVLTGLVGQATQAGSQLLQSTLLKLLEGLGTQAPGKRDLAKLQEVKERLQKFLEAMKAKKTEAKGVMAKGLARLEAVIEKIKNMSFLKQSLEKTTKEIDDAVDHHVQVTRRFLGDLGQQLVDTLKKTGEQVAQQLLGTLIGQLGTLGKRDLERRFLGDLGQQLIDTLKKTGEQVAQQLLGNVLGQLGNLGKRELHPAIQSLVDFFKPHVQTVVGSVQGLGETLKGHATNLWNTVQTHAGQLQTKLQGHVDELKTHGQTLLGHGKNAVDALKAAVTDILTQTLTNAKGSITDASKTVGEASKTITNHIVDVVKTAGN